MIEFDGAWVVHSETSIRLRKAGYVCGVSTIDDEGNPLLGKVTYTLHTWDEATGNTKQIAEFDSTKELNNMVKLLLPTED